MITALRLALSELKRMTSGRLPRITLVALLLVPLLYGATYLYANWNPQAHLSSIKAAIVVEDTGAVDQNGKEQHLGATVVKNLHDSGTFTFDDVDTREQADARVRTGEDAFAVIIPADFTKNLLSAGNIAPGDVGKGTTQGKIEVISNDTNNYTVNTFIDAMVKTVQKTIAANVASTTTDQLLVAMTTIHGKMLEAADGADKLHQGSTKLHDGTTQLVSGSAKLNDGAQQLDQGIGELQSGQAKLQQGADALADGAGQLDDGLAQLDAKTEALPASTEKLAQGSAQVARGNAQLNDKVQPVLTAVGKLPDDLQAQIDTELNTMVNGKDLTPDQALHIRTKLKVHLDNAAKIRDKANTASSQLQQLADGSQQVADGNRTLANSSVQLRGGIVQAHQGASKLDDGAGQLAKGLQSASGGVAKLKQGSSQLAQGTGQAVSASKQLNDGAKQLQDGTGTMASQVRQGAGEVPNPSEAQRKDIATMIGDPVSINKHVQAKAATYGAGLAPFFMSLALWVGVLMLSQVLRPVTRRAMTSNAPSWQIAIGGWLPFWACAIVQAGLLLLAVTLLVGLHPAYLPLTFGFMVLATLAFSALVQGLYALLGLPGKYVALVLLVLQLVTSGGTFPWQTTPEPLHVLHKILPMGHVVEGMRHLLYGSEIGAAASSAWLLLGYTAIGLTLSVVAVRIHKTSTLSHLQPELAE